MGWDQLDGTARVRSAEREAEARIDADPWYCPICLERLSRRGRSRDCPYGHWTRDY